VFIHPVRRGRPSHTMAHTASTSAVADEAAGLSRASAGLSPSGQATVPVTGILADGRPLVGHLKHITTSAVNGVVMLEATLTSRELSPGGMAVAAAIQQVTRMHNAHGEPRSSADQCTGLRRRLRADRSRCLGGPRLGQPAREPLVCRVARRRRCTAGHIGPAQPPSQWSRTLTNRGQHQGRAAPHPKGGGALPACPTAASPPATGGGRRTARPSSGRRETRRDSGRGIRLE
jgi:hypothetical protein